ncbi:MAG: ABC transporter ATP-binding protein [Ardenticatenaceae bacterium]|nr:ABC transporter ATP-binding protein [Ardenticatenaceae bacterium]MCB8949310.1 ABC transporter ATP-binding protein [Ardenticatenaceae bacterium]
MGRQYESDPDAKAKRLNRESLHTFGRLLQYVRPYRKQMAFSITLLLFSTLLGLVLPLVVQNLVDVVLIDKNQVRLNQLAIGLFVVFIVQALFSFGHRLSLAYVGEKVIAHIRVQIYTHLQSLSLKYYADHRTGEVVSRLTNDVSQLQTAVTDNLVALLRQAITLVGAAVLLFWLNWRLTLIILTGIPIISLTMVALGRQIRKAAKAVQDALAQSANVVEETVSGIRIVKSFVREAHEIGRFAERVNDIYEAAMWRAKIGAVLGPIIGFMAFASITITLWFGSFQVLEGRLTAGGLVAYLVYTLMVATPIASLAGLYAQFQSALGATERLFELLDTPADIANRPNATELPPVTGRVEFQDVDFDYTTAVPILKQVSFVAEPGQVVALVGPSGAGKSTLVNLIPRFYDVVNGRILIDGQDVRDVTVHSLRQQIGIVPQETILFSDTVLENIRYGNLDATQEELEAAAKAANAHEFILNDLPDGYQTLVGERGVKLSGGQRQRVAIARAILKDPRILILDEATSSLDSESESLVQEALERLMNGRTSFVIAHRLSTVINADWVLVLDQGRVVEQGRHSDLLQNPDGLYYRLYQMQFSSAADWRLEIGD